MRTWTLRGTLAALLLAAAPMAEAADKLTVAVSSLRAWDVTVVGFGERLGYFADNGLDIEIATTDNLAAAFQAVVAGSADIANTPLHTFLAASMQGAPVKMISALFNGASDWLWYVRSDSPIQSFRDVTPETTIGITSTGSTPYILIHSLMSQYGVSGELVAAGSQTAILTQVMTGQIDIGVDGNGLLGVPEYDAGNLRPIAYGRELESLRDVTVRGLVVTDQTLAERRDVLVRFVQAYKRTMDWMYSDPQALEWFAEDSGSSLSEAERVVRDLYPEGAMVIGEAAGIDASVQMALDFGRIDRAPTEEELAEMFDIVWQPGSM